MDESYWDNVYGDSYYVDGIYNAKEHARYVYALFNLMERKIQGLGDFGFGKGYLLKEFVRVFQPARVVAVEPSPERVAKVRAQSWVTKTHIQFHIAKLQDFNPNYLEYAPLDLSICNSVFQYIPESDLKSIVDRLARYTRYLYFTVPTKGDYIRMKKEIGFSDPYAFIRPLGYYRKLLAKKFEFVSLNLLKSKSVNDGIFQEELFRF
jgi:hypothetical protein